MTGTACGTLALVGGAEWTAGCSFDEELLSAADAKEVLVLPTAAAYGRPGSAVETAAAWLEPLGARVRGLMVLARSDAQADGNVDAVRAARFIYLGGGSPLHLRSVLKESKLLDALVAAWRDGAVVAGSSAGAMVLCDPMIDPRGGALTVGLGLVRRLAILPHYGTESAERMHRVLHLAGPEVVVAGLDERTALIRDPEGRWRVSGEGEARFFLDGQPTDPDALSIVQAP